MSRVPDDLAETRACHCLAARRKARAVTRLYEDALRPVGLRATQFSVLAALAQMSSNSMQPLADFLGVERTTLTRSVRLLEERGLLEDAGSEDRRQRVLRLSDAGHEILGRALPLWRGVQSRLDREEQDA